MITPYGAVLENNVPSPFESYQYFDQVGQRKAALELQRRELQRKAQQDAAEAYKNLIKPIADFKSDSGYFDVNKALNNAAITAQQKAAEMIAQKKGTGEVGAFVTQTVKELDTLQKYYKDASPILEKQITEAGKTFDPNTLRDIATVEMLYTDDGKGGRRLRTANELMDPNKVLTQAMSKNANALYVKNPEKLYDFPTDNTMKSDFKDIETRDGRKVYGSATVPYNTLFQDVVETKSGKYNVVTKSVPLERNGDVITDEKGKPLKALPLEAYTAFVSDPGRMWQLNKSVNDRLADIKKNNEVTAQMQAGKEMNQLYGDKLKSMPAAQRLSLQRQIKDRILQDIDEPDEEVIRQQVAYELADKNIPKREVQVNEMRDPSVRVINVNNSSSGKDSEIIPRDVFTNIKNKVGNKELSATEVGTDAMYVLKLIKSMGYKKTFKEAGQTKQIDYTPGEVKLKEEGGQLYALFDGNKLPIVPDDVNAPANSVKQEQELLKNKNKNTNTPAPKPSGSKTIPAAEWRKLSVAERQKKLQEGYKPQ